MLRLSLPGFLALALILTSTPLGAQLAESDWTQRPDRFAPPGIVADRLSPAGGFDARFQISHRSFSDLVDGRNAIPSSVVLQNWDFAPLTAQRQRAVAEVGFGLTSWMSVLGRVPLVRNEVQIGNNQSISTTNTTGVGDVEAHALFGLHDQWPVRAHLSAGVSIPTGTSDQTGTLTGSSEAVLPYFFQLGAGTPALLPSATLVTENAYGTVGFQATGRYHLGENDRDWSPGDEFTANVYMQYRFNDWIGGSMRVEYQRRSAVSGLDPSLDPFLSPLHFATATGGTSVMVPFGVNIEFAEGALRGNRLQAELLIPAHSELNGPQLRESWGASVSWGWSFGGNRPGLAPERPTDRQATRGPIQRPDGPPGGEHIHTAPTDRPADPLAPEAEVSRTELCLSTGESVMVGVTPDGRLQLAPGEEPVDPAALSSDRLPGFYADQQPWYVTDDPILFRDRDHLRSGALFRADCQELTRVGEVGDVPLFVTLETEEPYEALHVPVSPGLWQLYRADLARVRG